MRRILNAVQIAGQPPVRRGDHNAAGVRKLIAEGIVVVTEADCPGEPVDGRLIAGQEMPASSRSVAAIGSRVVSFFLGCQRGRFAGMEAGGHHLIIAYAFGRNWIADIESVVSL